MQLVPMSLQLEKIARLGENLLNNISLVLYIGAMQKKQYSVPVKMIARVKVAHRA